MEMRMPYNRMENKHRTNGPQGVFTTRIGFAWLCDFFLKQRSRLFLPGVSSYGLESGFPFWGKAPPPGSPAASLLRPIKTVEQSRAADRHGRSTR
jgi:hypothetical protein